MTRKSGSFSFAGSLAVLLMSCLGCAPGIDWEFGRYRDVQREAAEQNQVTFVYFRHWTSIRSTQFEEDVLSAAPVRAATRQLVAVPLDFVIDKKLAERWDLDEPPAYALIAPNGALLVARQGPVPVDVVLADIEEALAAARSSDDAPTVPEAGHP